MEALITNNVEVSVLTRFENNLSDVENNRYVFVYTITIKNHNNFPVQLTNRMWYIFDSIGEANIVHGSGVVGEFPSLQKDESYEYSSFCELKTDAGFMNGSYIFINKETGLAFQVGIPEFQLNFPPRLN